MVSGIVYDLILFDRRRKGEDGWLEEDMRKVCGDAIIIGLTDKPEVMVVPLGDRESVHAWLVNENLAEIVLQWALHQGIERKGFLAERDWLRNQLGESSYRMEMVDVASTVLHNVGNVLNSVNVAANVVQELVNHSSVMLINRMAELLKGHEKDMATFLTLDPKGKRIPPALMKLGCHLIDEQQAILKEINGLVRNIDHVKQIISSHQSMAKSPGRAERLLVKDLLDQAVELSIHPDDTKWLTIHRQYQDVPCVLVDKHQLLQILVNLLRNAKQAMQQQVDVSHNLILRVEPGNQAPSSVVMTIQDTGIGIAPEHLVRMFTRGFTTKKDGNGIGLHSSLLTIQNMGGSLHVHSDGLGMGAIFTLTFPVAKATAE